MVFVGWGGETGFDYRAGEGDGVIWLDVETSGDGGCYIGREIVTGIFRVGFAFELYSLGSCGLLGK